MSLGWVLGWCGGGAEVMGSATGGSYGEQRSKVQVAKLEG